MKLALYGYGRLARGIERALPLFPDLTLTDVFTRRPEAVNPQSERVTVHPAADADAWQGDVMLLAVGSAVDLPTVAPRLAHCFSFVDACDNHPRLHAYYDAIDATAQKNGHTALVACGWDPGLFSLARLYGAATMPNGENATFWGPGVSQGHSEAVRHLAGVRDARSITLPAEDAMKTVEAGGRLSAPSAPTVRRVCEVLTAPDADFEQIRREIVGMPNYFAGTATEVLFLSEPEFAAHDTDRHGGTVLCNGTVDGEQMQASLRLTLASNPLFTGAVMLAYARAVARMASRGEYGAKTVFDVRPVDLLPPDADPFSYL